MTRLTWKYYFKRQITDRHHYRTKDHPHNAKDSVVITLSCGHEKHYKGSQEPKGQFAYCSECEEL